MDKIEILNNRAINFIRNYEENIVPELPNYFDIDHIRKREYERWALEELIFNIISKPDQEFWKTLTEFYESVLEYATNGSATSRIFEPASEILYCLIESLNLHSL